MALTENDIWTSPSDGEAGEVNRQVLIGIDNANSYNYETEERGPPWISGGIWGYRVRYKDGSAVTNKGIPVTGSHNGIEQTFFKSILTLNEITESEVFYELLDQVGEIVGKFRVTLPGCSPCTTCDIKPRIGSVDYEIPIGISDPKKGFQGRPCNLRFYQDQIPLIGRESLSLIAPGSGDPSIITTHDANGNVETIRIGDTFTRIEQLGGGTEPGAGPLTLQVKVSLDWQNPDTTVYRTITITNKMDGTIPYLEFENLVGGASTLTAYRQSPTGEWIMDTSNGTRRETRSTTETASVRIVRSTISDRISSNPDTYAVVSDTSTTYNSGTYGWEKFSVVIDPAGQALATTTSYYQPGEDSSPNGSGSSAGLGRVKQILHPNGEIEHHYYFGYPEGELFDSVHVIRKAFAGIQEHRETTTETGKGTSPDTGREVIVTRVTERVGTQVVSLIENSREDIIDAGFNGYVTETRSYSSPTEFTSKFTFESSGIDKAITVVNPDGTASVSSRMVDAVSGYTTITNIVGFVQDEPVNGLPQLVMVAMNESITDKYDEQIANNSYRYKDGVQVLISRKLATEFDSLHRATRFEHYVEGSDTPVFVTEIEYGCCGIARELDKDGINTYYAYDAQKRLIMTNRDNITTETVHQGLTTSTHRYTQSVAPGGYLMQLGLASAANEISRMVSDVIGNTIAVWSRSPQDGSMVETTSTTTYNTGGGIGMRVVTHPPVTVDDGTAMPEQIDEYYLDGKLATSKGNLQPNRISRYSAAATGLVTEASFLDGAVERETTTSQHDWAGRQVKMTYASDADGVGGNDFSSASYNSKGQLAMTIDPDGLTQLYGYNFRGEQTLTAIDLNGNNLIDLAVDQVTSSETDLVIRYGGGWVMRTSQIAWLDLDSDVGTAVAYSDVSLDGLRLWSIQNPSVQNHESTSITTLGAAGIRTELITHPDSTTQTTESVGGLVGSVTNRDADGAILYHLDYAYDSLNRPFTQTDSRTGTSTSYYVNGATDVLTRAVDHLSRETLFTYDHRGRAKTTDLPDTLNESGGIIANISQTFYFPDGSVREQSGDGGYRSTQTYDYAGRPATLTTYGTETAVTRWLYDRNRGLLTGKLYNSPTPGSGQGPSYTYTAGARLKTRTQARLISGNPLVTTYTYGTASGSTPASLDQVTHSGGTPAFTVSTRDRLGRPLSVLDPAAGNRSLKYTRHGALEEDSTTSGILAGQKLVQGFDSRLRPRSHTASFGAQALGETIYQYGPSGAVRSVSGNGSTASYFYHPQQRTLENVTYTQEGESASGPMLQSTRKHDAANRLTRITAHVNDAGVQKPIDHHAYDYDALDHIQKHTGITGAFWKYGYNATGEVTGATRKMPDATTDYFGRNYRYHYDGIGNRTSVEQSRDGAQASRVSSYSPNALNQYTTITHPDFINVSGTANPLAAVTVNGIAAARQSDYFYKELSEDNSAGPQWIDATITDGTTTTNGSLSLPAIETSPVHDDDGNLTSDGEWIYTWDAENRLIGVERSPAALAAGAPYHREKHDYDHRSRRIRTTIFANTSNTHSSQTLYIFDGWKCVAELDSSGQPVRKYIWGLDLVNRLGDASTGSVGALLWLVDTATAKTHIHLYDKNGNVAGLVDATTRKRSATYDYDAFGQLIACYGGYAKQNPFTFSTKFTDCATGLRYYGYRWYGAKDGRWLSRDPIAEDGGINLYGFLINDGINQWDILGKILDSRSEEHISRLYSKLAFAARIHILKTNAAVASAPNKSKYEAKIISSHRTYEEQDELYNKGRRSIKGEGKVTNAKGGFSNHNFRLAYDIAFFCGDKVKWDGPEYDIAGKVGMSLGLIWGGAWKSLIDKPHFEYPYKGNLKDLRDLKKNADDEGENEVDLPDSLEQIDLNNKVLRLFPDDGLWSL